MGDKVEFEARVWLVGGPGKKVAVLTVPRHFLNRKRISVNKFYKVVLKEVA